MYTFLQLSGLFLPPAYSPLCRHIHEQKAQEGLGP